MTTTRLKIFLILWSMGINVLISQRRTPTIIIAIKTLRSGIIKEFKSLLQR
jgi:hypothetical protein